MVIAPAGHGGPDYRSGPSVECFGELDLPLAVTRIPAPNSPVPPNEAARPALRAKTIATRLTLEELQEVEAAVERDGKPLAEWLRDLALAVGPRAVGGPDRAALG